MPMLQCPHEPRGIIGAQRIFDRIIGLLDSKMQKPSRGQRVDKHILITRYHPSRAARGEMLSINDVLKSYQLHPLWASFLRARKCCALPTLDRQ